MNYIILPTLLLLACPKAIDDPQEEQHGIEQPDGDSEQTQSDESKAGEDQSAQSDDAESKPPEDAAPAADDE